MWVYRLSLYSCNPLWLDHNMNIFLRIFLCYFPQRSWVVSMLLNTQVAFTTFIRLSNSSRLSMGRKKLKIHRKWCIRKSIQLVYVSSESLYDKTFCVRLCVKCNFISHFVILFYILHLIFTSNNLSILVLHTHSIQRV